ncbi:MAG: hypothetical protein ACOCP8_00080 [archaeon]
MKKVASILLLILILLAIPIDVSYANESDIPGLIDYTDKISSLNYEKIENIKAQLVENGIQLNFMITENVVTQDHLSYMKKIYYTTLNKMDNNNQLVYIFYFSHEGEFYIYQDSRNFINNNIVQYLQNTINVYKAKNDLNDGILYVYSKTANEIANKLEINIEGLELTKKYRNNNWFKLNYVIAMQIALVLILSFRKK